MTIHFITAEISLEASSVDLIPAIEAALQSWGEPLRWAITTIDPNTHMATVEAVVTCA
ncbi:hypothetical protein [Myxacorys almedinensis]|uniref:hypothetical protein n=1 Tax=Myxacorys almedinensis TaxID=2651157 RepID=UPI00192F0EB5|nr:hypothetical protein [Myxacorys almedinensis]